MKDSKHDLRSSTTSLSDAQHALLASVPAPIIKEVFQDSGPNPGPVENNTRIDDAMPRFSGTAAPFSLVSIYSVPGGKLGEGYANENGEFSFVITAPLPGGNNAIAAFAELNGQKSPASNRIDLNYLSLTHPADPDQPVDQAPTLSTPVIEGVYDNRGGQETRLEGFLIGDATPLLKGSADPHVLIYITNLLGEPVGSTYVKADGTWEVEVSHLSGEAKDALFGPFRAIAVDPENLASVSYSSKTVDFRVQAESIVEPENPQLPEKPTAPLIESLFDNVGKTEFISSGGVTDDAMPTVSGKASPNSLIRLFTGARVIGEGYANEQGYFSIEVNRPLDIGFNIIRATSVIDGVQSDDSNYFSVTFSDTPVGTDPFIAPYIVEVTADEPNHHMVTNGGSTPDTTPLLRGMANHYATVIIRLNGEIFAEVRANDKGHWFFEPRTPLNLGENVFTFAAVDNEGQEQISAQSFTLQVTPSVTVLYAEDDVGPQTDALTSGQMTDDDRPTLHGTGSPNGLVTIYTEKGILGSAVVNEQGKWSFTPDNDLPPDTYRFRPVINHPDAEHPFSGEYFELVILAPVPLTPEIVHVFDNVGNSSWLSSGAITDDATPTFNGYVDAAGMTIVVRDNGKVIGNADVGHNGDWRYTPTPPLEAGNHSLTFEIVDAKGKVHASEPFILEVVAPIVTQILSADDNEGDEQSSLISGAHTDDATPTLQGTGTPNAIVNLYNGYNYLGSAKINDDGTWSFTPNSPLAKGQYHFTAREVDQYGSLQPASAEFILDISPPIEYFAPTLSSVYDYVGRHKELKEGDYTDDTAPEFNGRGMPGSTIRVYVDGKPVGEVQVSDWSYWNFKPNPALQPGDHTFSFATVGADGKEYASEAFNLQIITHTPGRIDLAEDNVGDVTDPLNSGARTDDTTPTLKGVGTPNGIVTIYDNWNPIGSAKINANGEWSFTPSRDLQAGSHSFNAVVTGPDGTTLAASPDFRLDIQLPPPPIEYFAPTISNVYDDEGRQTYLQNGSLTDDARPRFSGRGMPNTKIDVLLDGQKIGEADINFMGYWSFTPAQPLTSGHHSFSFVTVGADGTDYASETFSLEVITQLAARIDFAEDNVGDVTDPLTSGARTDDTTPTLHGVGTPGGIVTIYYGNWSTFGSAKINADGTWNVTPNRPLPAGEHSLFALVTAPDGTTLPASPIFTLDIVPFVPPIEYFAPTISNVYDDEGRQTYLQNGSLTDDARPRFSGRGMPNTKIDVLLDGQKIGEADINFMGYWSFTPAQPLASGHHSFSFVTVGADGTDYASETFSLEVITQVAGRIDSAEDNVGDVTDPLTSGARTDDTTPTLHGVGTANGIVKIYNNYNYLGSAKITAEGTWSFTPQSALQDGTHNFQVAVTGPDGTTLPRSPSFSLTIAKPVDYFAPNVDSVTASVGSYRNLSDKGITSDSTPSFAGRGVPNSKIEVRDNGKKIGEIDVSRYGEWTYTPETDLISGNHSFTFVTRNEKGDEFVSESFTLEIIVQVPGRIDFADDDVGDVTDPLTSGSRTDDNTPTLHGIGTPGGTVEIHDGYRYLGSAKILADGTWRFTPSFLLQDGTHNFHATVTGPDGTTLPRSPAFELIIAKPVDYFIPTISEVEDNAGRHSYILFGGITDDTTPTFSGRAVPGSTLEVRINGITVRTVEVNEAGRWSWSPSPALQPGKHAFTFVSVDAGGKEFISDEIPLEIITHVTGRIISADDNIGEVTSALTSGSTTDDAQPMLRGIGTPGGSVEIFFDDMLMGYAEINDKGEWSYTPKSTLGNGSHEFYVVVTSPDGTKLPAGPTFSLIIDAPVLYSAPVIDGVVDNVHGQTILSDGDTTDDATPTFVGKALADSTIAVYVNDKYYGDAKVDPWGDWVYRPSPALNKGEHTFSFVSVDDKGGEYRSEAFTLHIDPAIPLAILCADDDIGAVTDPLFSGSSTDDTQPTLRGTGKPGSIIEIFGTDGLYATETISPEGNWSWTPDQPLSAGSYQFIGVIRIPGRFDSERTDVFELTITAPESDRSIDMRSLLQDGDAPLFDEPQAELSTRQPIEPTAVVPASDPLVQDWETTTNHY